MQCSYKESEYQCEKQTHASQKRRNFIITKAKHMKLKKKKKEDMLHAI